MPIFVKRVIMDANKSLLLGGLTAGALGLGKAIIGGIQAIRGNKEMKNLLSNRPIYSIPESYKTSLGIAQNLASGEMPGQSYYEQRIGESSARQIGAAEKGAISSNVLQGAVSNIQDKELNAIQGLAKMGAEYRTTQMQSYAGALNQYGQLQDQQFDYNVASPFDIKLNMANDKKMAGIANAWGGLNDIGSTIMNYTGTKYRGEVIKNLMELMRQKGIQPAVINSILQNT
jgi:hypothetical protein